MPTLKSRLDRLEKRQKAEADIDLASVFDRAAEFPGIPHDDRQRFHEMASDRRQTGGKEYARLLHELSDDGLDALGEMREISRRTDPREHAELFAGLADDSSLATDDRQECRRLAGQLRNGLLDLASALRELPDAALERAGGYHEHFNERCDDGE